MVTNSPPDSECQEPRCCNLGPIYPRSIPKRQSPRSLLKRPSCSGAPTGRCTQAWRGLSQVGFPSVLLVTIPDPSDHYWSRSQLFHQITNVHDPSYCVILYQPGLINSYILSGQKSLTSINPSLQMDDGLSTSPSWLPVAHPS